MRPPRVFLRALAALLFSAPALAQEPPEMEAPSQPISRPAAAERIVRTFSFERSNREIFAVPRYWDLAQDGSSATGPRPGYPRFNSAALDFTTAYAGEGSVRLTSQGGSVCLRLEPGVIPVFANIDYLVSARARTSSLRHSRAALTARYLDHAGYPIPGSERRSALIAGHDWSLLTVTLPGELPSAAFLEIDLELLQPREFQSPALGQHHVWPQDFPASAWFDEVSVVQLPRVRLTTNSTFGIITAPGVPALSAVIRDLTGEALQMTLTIQDPAGRIVDTREDAVAAGSGLWEWSPRLPGFGWYRATLELSSRGVRVGSTRTDFAWVPPPARAGDADPLAFTILLDKLPPGAGPDLARLIQTLGSGQVSIPVWTRNLTTHAMEQHVNHLGEVIESLGPDTEVMFSLALVPADLAEGVRVEPERTAAAFRAPERLWAPYLLPLLDKFGQRVQRWQIGSLSVLPSTQDAAGVERLRAFLSRLVPGPTLMSPSPAELPSSAALREQLIHISAAMSPAAAGELARRTSGDPFARPIFALQTLPPEYGRDQAALDLVRRTVEIWAAVRTAPGDLAPRIALAQPWQWASPDRPIMPTSEFAALRTTIEQLSGRHFVTTFPTEPGITAYLFASPDQRSGTLIAWRSGPIEPAYLRGYLGGDPIAARDIFGNSTPIALASDGPGPMVHRIPLTDSPLFIENVDPQLCQFIAAFAIDPPIIPVTAGEHQLDIQLSNPWSTRVDGRLSILEPGGLSSGDPESRDRSWRIHPRLGSFSIAPGQTTSLPISFVFSGVEDAGQKQFLVEVDLNAERSYPPIRVSQQVELAADRIQLDLSYRRIPDSADLIVEAQVTNKSVEPMTLELSAIAPGVPRSKASISDLEPGATATRRFILQGAARHLSGQTVTVTAQEFQTRARITRSIRPD
jgi:hypothetical protein